MTGYTSAVGDTTFAAHLPNYFDFTLEFEHIILTIIPCVSFLTAVAIKLHRSRKKVVIVRHGALFWAKMVRLYSMRPILHQHS